MTRNKIKIIPNKILKPKLIRRLCKVLTEQEKKELGNIQIKMVPKGSTHVEKKLCLISFYQVWYNERNKDCNLYHNFNAMLADHLYWCFGKILQNKINHNISPCDISNKLSLRAKQKKLLDVYDYKEYGLFSKVRRKHVDKCLDNIKKKKNFAGNMRIIHHIRKIKLGKNYKYSTPQLFMELFSNNIYKPKPYVTFNTYNKYHVSPEYRKFMRNIAPKLPHKIYIGKKGRKYIYFEDKALKKALKMFMNDFKLFCDYYPILCWADKTPQNIRSVYSVRLEHFKGLEEKYVQNGFKQS